MLPNTKILDIVSIIPFFNESPILFITFARQIYETIIYRAQQMLIKLREKSLKRTEALKVKLLKRTQQCAEGSLNAMTFLGDTLR